jgi:hypothetical protein
MYTVSLISPLADPLATALVDALTAALEDRIVGAPASHPSKSQQAAPSPASAGAF